MTPFNKMRPTTSRGYVPYHVLIKNVPNCLVAFLDFCFRKTIKTSKFLEFSLPLGDPLVATFNETRAFQENMSLNLIK